MKLISVALATVCGVAALSSSSASACTVPLCRLSQAFPKEGRLPANMVKLRFSPGAGQRDPNTPLPKLYRMDGTTKISVAIERTPIDAYSEWLTPTESLPVGTELLLEAEESFCPPYEDQKPLQATYTVTEAKPLPTMLGTLGVNYDRGVITVPSSASCTEMVDASYADLFVQLTPEALPYAFLFDHEMYIDGELHPRLTSRELYESQPNSFGRAYTVCYEKPGTKPDGKPVSAGTHNVRFEGTLPDGTKLVTPELSVTLRCDGPILTWGDPDAAVPDAGPKNDAGAAYVPDGGLDAGGAGGVDGGTSPTVSDDDGCSLASRRSGFSGMLLALALLLRRRRR